MRSKSSGCIFLSTFLGRCHTIVGERFVKNVVHLTGRCDLDDPDNRSRKDGTEVLERSALPSRLNIERAILGTVKK